MMSIPGYLRQRVLFEKILLPKSDLSLFSQASLQESSSALNSCWTPLWNSSMFETSRTCSVQTANELGTLKSVATCPIDVWGASVHTYKINVLKLRRKNPPVLILLHLTTQLTATNGILGFQKRMQKQIVYQATSAAHSRLRQNSISNALEILNKRTIVSHPSIDSSVFSIKICGPNGIRNKEEGEVDSFGI